MASSCCVETLVEVTAGSTVSAVDVPAAVDRLMFVGVDDM